MTFSHPRNIADTPVFVDGIARCGKSSLSKVIPSLTSMEHIQFAEEVELILAGTALGGCTREYAKSFMRIFLNRLSYDNRIGRRVNFRPSDQTGVANYRNPSIYFSRLNIEEGPTIVQELDKSSSFMPFITHDFLVNLDLIDYVFNAYKMLSLWRDPVDVAYSWWTRGWGERFFNSDPSNFTMMLKDEKGFLFPWYCSNYSHVLPSMNPTERCAHIVLDLLDRSVANAKENCESSRINVFFEDLCTDPWTQLERICKFIGVGETAATRDAVLEARFPRELKVKDRLMKEKHFEEYLSSSLLDALMSNAEEYRSTRYGLV